MGIDEAGRGTCTTIFMLPAIEMVYEQLLKYGFLNAYLDDVLYQGEHGKSIFLLFKPKRFEPLQTFIKSLHVNGKITDDYDYEKGYVVTVHPIPTKYIKDYMLFKQGRYSEFSKPYKDLFPQYTEMEVSGFRVKQPSLQRLIFEKHHSMRKYWSEKLGAPLADDAEVWSKPDIYGFETLNIQKYDSMVD